ncbi:hypothetical protein BT96DRAFT_999617 [Gymnopus androsaceus JB14]|uniref:Uncharacterized protein n=1 Tax=Gymnopus androsaceus JB14 TaxID=1447944 RepID=A0A6A4H7D0_9AGAR|nr:hypothetical protein BT96DRAFT_999617 [Gymnopus androsaceus JB14]
MSLATNISVVGNTVHIHPQPGSTINITVTPTSPGPLRFTFEFPTNSIHQWQSSIDANDSVVPDSESARLEELERFNEQERNDAVIQYRALVAEGLLPTATPSPVKTFLQTLDAVSSPTPSPLKNFEAMLNRDPGRSSPDPIKSRANPHLREDSTTEDDTGDEAPVAGEKDSTTEDDTSDYELVPYHGSRSTLAVATAGETHSAPAHRISASMSNYEMEDADDEMSATGDSDHDMHNIEDAEEGTQMLATYSQLMFG